ncbi:unnamed protein product [Ambrosiozyma monospora]|uniref:Unnamed protein product n=1 Tax=Ambrosiozyma monospora TaxID=43982 RepID=A0ACB5SY42_AMBMO|nr:unnamed protein product [Ambrosiozyma monospora]
MLAKGSSFQVMTNDDASSEYSESFEEEDDYDNADESIYYTARDGLFDRHPQDDSPNDYKFGWITIYDKQQYFDYDKAKASGSEPAQFNWEVVLAMSLASAVETHFESLIMKTAD